MKEKHIGDKKVFDNTHPGPILLVWEGLELESCEGWTHTVRTPMLLDDWLNDWCTLGRAISGKWHRSCVLYILRFLEGFDWPEVNFVLIRRIEKAKLSPSAM